MKINQIRKQIPKNTPVMLTLCVILVVAVVFLGGCKKSEDSVVGGLTGINWVLDSIEHTGHGMTPIHAPFHLLFRDDLVLEMVVHCNTCIGTYRSGPGGTVTIPAPSSCTEKNCGLHSHDHEFMMALTETSHYEVEGNRMRLLYDNGQGRLHFTAH